MPDGYGSHQDYMSRVKEEADLRQGEVEAALRDAFSTFIERREVEVVVFAGMSALDLAKAILGHPIILKALLASCNIAGRAIERDLEIKNLDTYSPHITQDHANVIAGYIKPFLPPFLELPALSQIDRVSYIDKEIRKGKGRWERHVLKALNRYGRTTFIKRKFRVGKEHFELDAAAPQTGEVEIGIDVKRIEARRDIHKRGDEIVNKAARLKEVLPRARFGVVIYYPFIDEQINVQSRLTSPYIEGVVFASEAQESIENAVRLLLSTLGASRNG
jgi:hypothetical protein